MIYLFSEEFKKMFDTIKNESILKNGGYVMKTQVLVIGAGPVGLMAALLLANQGISVIVADRRIERMTAPKAHAVNPRTIEICHQAGIPGDLVREHGTPAHQAGDVRFVSTLSGVEFGALPYERQTDAALSITPFPLINTSQPKFEFLVSSELQKKPNVSLLRGAQCDEVYQDEKGVTAQLKLRGSADPLSIEADYVIAADGAGSRTRERLGIAMEGPEALQHYVMLHCEGDLGPHIDHRPGVLYFVFEPDANGVFIIYDDTKSWVFMKSYDPNTETPEDFDETRCREEINKAIGVDDVAYAIRNVSPWTMSAQIAEKYRDGRIFLVGDAAHRFPPTGGLGLNTGVGDAHNLCWKLAQVLQGTGTNALLDTYEAERRPVAVNNSNQSLANAAKMFEVFGALYGDDPAAMAERFATMCEMGADNADLKTAIEAQRPHFDSIQLQLGYRYSSPALVGAAPLEDPLDDDISKYTPSYDVGALLPHEWFTGADEKLSSLFLLSQNGFTLINGPKAAAGWTEPSSSPVSIVERPTSWPAGSGLNDQSAILVRPDGHIAARYDTTTETTFAQILQDVAAIQKGEG